MRKIVFTEFCCLRGGLGNVSQVSVLIQANSGPDLVSIETETQTGRTLDET